MTKEALAQKWGEIRGIIAALPEEAYLYGLLEKIGAKRTLEDIGVTEDERDSLLEHSPLVRNRLTLMRTRRMMKLDEINNVIHI